MNADEPASRSEATEETTADRPAETVRRFVAKLLRRYESLRGAGAKEDDTETGRQVVTELLLGEAALRCGPCAIGEMKKRPRQVAVLGPTQTGKSTIVNLIVSKPVAEVSPLAGFTTHPHGVWIGAAGAPDGWTDALFPGWQRRDAEQLSRDELEHYALTRLPAGHGRPGDLPECVVWDTPDFDTLSAHAYRRSVLEVAALADAHVFVLSKEKYCDLSVWRMLRLLNPLDRPLLVCLNKLTPDAAEAVAASLKQRLSELGGRAASAPVVTFGYEPGLSAQAGHEQNHGVAELRRGIGGELEAAGTGGRDAGVRVYVRRHWKDWTSPVEIELAAIHTWHERVSAALAEATESYRRELLEHPQRFDTFRRAIAELLHLLELPGIANVMSQVRNVLSWPARRLFAARQAWLLRRRKDGAVPHGLGSEEVVLFELIERLLTALERDAARRSDPAMPGHAVWRALARRLEQQQGRLRDVFQNAARAQREEFTPVIHSTANELYETLRKRPAVLNTLRAARASTDIAGIALAIKAGGLNLNDLLFAPAMFALTSILTEGALGSYMTRVASNLKKRQLEHVRTRLIEGVFASELHGLAGSLEDPNLLGISREQMQAATRALETWERTEDE